jgi:hypothetical protein
MKRKLLGAASLLLVILVAGCGGADAPDREAAGGPQSRVQVTPRTGPTPPTAPTTLEGLEHTRRPLGSPKALPNSGYAVDTASREQVRLFYKTVFASSDNVASGWNGNVAGCTAGDTTADFKAAVLRRINWFRAMAGVPASVQFDSTFNQKAQQAALLMAARNPDEQHVQGLSHFPTADWTCFPQMLFGAEAAGKSNLALGSIGADSVSSYMQEPDANNPAVGHRRWLLYPQTQLMGTGDVAGVIPTNAIWVQDGNFGTGRPLVRDPDQFVAWPPRGYAPYQTVYPRWSLSYPNANFAGATVTMLKNGVPLGTTKEAVQNGFGENTIVWIPAGYTDTMTWAKPSADDTYTVTISNVTGVNVPSSFNYTVTVFDPETAGIGDGPITIAGSDTLASNTPGSYSFATLPGANTYQWRVLSASAFSGDGAESGAGNFTASVSAGYNVVTSDVHAGGANAFHLAHGTAPGFVVDQVLRLNQELVASANATLNFKSRLGLSSPDQRAMVEVSADQGATWTVVYEQAGQQTGQTVVFGEPSFTTRSIALGAFANRVILVRFRYAFASGVFYGGAQSGIGWYIDDISATNMSTVATTATTVTGDPHFTLTSGAGQVLLQGRAGMYGYYADWGLTKTVTVLAPNPSDCLFDWAEAQLGPGLAAHTPSVNYLGVFYLRQYSSGLILGVSLVDLPNLDVVANNVYYALNGEIHALGPAAAWYAQASCQ